MKEQDSISKLTNKKLALIFVLALAANFLGSWYGYAMMHGQILTQAILGLCIPFSNLFYSNAFIEARSISDRIKITFAAALALSTGSTLMLLFQKYILNNETLF
jgi:hypothetical protein